jgi:branched-chain amino acid transport system ATP-binding protein
MTNPDLLLLDEPTEGLAPLIVDQMEQIIARLKQQRQTILLVEQHLGLVLDLADYVYILNKGRVVFEGKPANLRGNLEIQSQYLGI